jgi:hypothetical protein
MNQEIKFINVGFDQLESVNDILSSLNIDLQSIIAINELGNYTRIWYID